MKGIKLKGNYQERAYQINNFIAELGGKKIRRKRNLFSHKLEYNFSGKRAGACHPSTARKQATTWDEQPCFGYRTVQSKSHYGGYEEQNRIFMKANHRYDIVSHYTLVDCKASCYHDAIVVCVRELKKSGDVLMVAHVAGKCPYCTYYERY
jgi:hypothetical protein